MLTRHPFSTWRRRGVALITALGLLSLLALIGTTYATMAQVERSVAASYVDKVRARMASQAGVEYAVRRLTQALAERPHSTSADPWVFRGEDVNGNDVLDAGEDLPWFCGSQNGMPDFNIDIELAPWFSFAPSPNAPSGLLPATYDNGSDEFCLKVMDSNGMIWLNQGNLANSSDQANMPLRQMLRTLLQRTFQFSFGESGRVANEIVDNRPPEGYASKRDVWRSIREFDPDTAKLLNSCVSDFLTVTAWVDENVVAPVSLEDRCIEGWTPISERPTQYWGLRKYVFDMAQLVPKRIAKARRAPIDINTAAPEVLEAVLTGVYGYYLDEGFDASWDALEISRTFTIEPGEKACTRRAAMGFWKCSTPVSDDAATKLVRGDAARDWEGLLAWRRDPARAFRSFSDLEVFLAAAVDRRVIDVHQADAIVANADPNTRLNLYNPNGSVYRRISKIDFESSQQEQPAMWGMGTSITFTGPTTEFCFGPMGRFEIHSLGRVRDGEGRIVAEARRECEVEVAQVYRETTQAQFNAGTFSASTAGRTTSGTGMQTFPEPTMFRGRTLGIAANPYDGQVELDTIEVTRSRGDARMAMRASFDGQADLSEGVDGLKARRPEKADFPKSAPLREGGSVLPDGIYAEALRTPCYDIHNIVAPDAGPADEPQGNMGTVMFWHKPNFTPTVTRKARSMVHMSTILDASQVIDTPTCWENLNENTKMWQFAYYPQGAFASGIPDSITQAWAWHSERAFDVVDTGFESLRYTPETSAGRELQRGRWHHVAVTWNMNVAEEGAFSLFIDGQHVDVVPMWGPDYWSALAPGPFESCIVPENRGIRLGELLNPGMGCIHGSSPMCRGQQSADATFDEVMAFSDVKDEAFIWSEFDRGRYYPETDAVFTSSPTPCRGRLLSCSFGGVVPSDLTGGSTGIRLVGDSGPLTGWSDSPSGSLGVGLGANGGAPLLGSGPVRYEIRMKSVDQGALVPALDTPVLDDVTLVFQEKVRFLSMVDR